MIGYPKAPNAMSQPSKPNARHNNVAACDTAVVIQSSRYPIPHAAPTRSSPSAFASQPPSPWPFP